MQPPPASSFCLHSISVPLSSVFLDFFARARRVDIFFNESSFTLCFEDRNSPHKRSLIDADLSEAAFLLYAASASCFLLFASVEVSSLRIDVTVKENQIFSTTDFIESPLSPTQFDKVSACVALQELASQWSPDYLRVPLYVHDMETQEEFVSSLKVAYSCIQRSHSSICGARDRLPQPKQVKIRLLDYQLDAIRWMLLREAGISSPVNADWIKSFFIPVTATNAEGGPVYFSTLTGHFVKTMPDIDSSSCLGGILADEMGLGKTLEIISLILLHPFTAHLDVLGRLYSLSRNGDLPSNCVAFSVGTSSDLQPENALTMELHDAVESDDLTEPMDGSCDYEKLLCPCGGVPETANLPTISCTNCLSPLQQHVACVQYEPVIYQPDGLRIVCNYICPHCWSELRVHSKATLIVSPDHIFRQWQDELLDHVDLKNLIVVIYNGIDAPATRLIQDNGSRWPSGKKRLRHREVESEFRPSFVQPSLLAAADIVLTTYSTVQRELGWASVSVEQRTGLGHRPNLRTAQRYLTTPSPLACVIWWRLCLDEAQMVENVTSKTARMLSEVNAVHRWCVTGTPAEKSIDDFYGLLAYLRVEPFCHRHYWNCLLYQPFLATVRQSQQKNMKDLTEAISKTSLVTVLSQILWRNTKSLVGNQLTLPTVSEKIHWVDFTSVERYIHDRVLSECTKTLEEVFQEELSQPRTCLDPSPSKEDLLEKPLSALSGVAHWRLIGLVTRARQACTHASLVVLNASQRHGRSGPHRGVSGRAAAANGACNGKSVGEYSDYRTSADPTLQASMSNRFHGTGCATMTEVIRRVIDETRQECESDYRSWVFSKNGAAGCFILKEKYIDAANCYRDVLQTATKLEKKYGVLSDWSQRLHAITNLNWLIQCCSVPFADDPPVADCIDATRQIAGVCQQTLPASASNVSDLPTWDSLDQRVDRDLVTKAKLLRLEYLKLHSRLLSKAREKLDPLTDQVEGLMSPPSVSTNDSWLDVLSDAMDQLALVDILDKIPTMLSASFQGRPSTYSQFKTTLLHVNSGSTLKSLLLVELKNIFDMRQSLQEAMKPLDRTWTTFQEEGEADRTILQKYYACCAREQDFTNSKNKKSKDVSSGQAERDQTSTASSPLKRRGRPRSARCAYCLASEALHRYRQTLNYERSSSAGPSARALRAGDDTLLTDDADLDALSTNADLTSVGMANPLIVGLQIVSTQISRLSTDRVYWKEVSSRLERLLQLLMRELLFIGRVHFLTKEWWNVHDDAEQFVLRLQATSPTDLAFVPPDEVDSQLQSQTADALTAWSTLKSRLGHLAFLRNALQQQSESGRPGAGQLECPACLMIHSPERPTFVLLPGCWHSLCLACYDRIRGLAVAAQRRCPVCRAPFLLIAGGNRAVRRHPLTLMHFGGGEVDEQKAAVEDGNHSASEGDRILGDHSSKVREVVRCLKAIKRDDADAKAVVFSSWLSVLYTMARALEQNGIAFATLFKARDARDLAGFRCAGSRTWVLLLPIQLGSNGLNLTEANHVLLIDPVLSHGRETQAIARLHRIGQTRCCIVHRFIVRDSIEMALHSLHSRLPLASETDCMVGAGARRSSSHASGTAGPGEDRAQLLQMTVGQLVQLLKLDVAGLNGDGESNDCVAINPKDSF
ncbi:hypothetical protein AAHC03_09934 [Spirometra sp. Aus1]